MDRIEIEAYREQSIIKVDFLQFCAQKFEGHPEATKIATASLIMVLYCLKIKFNPDPFTKSRFYLLFFPDPVHHLCLSIRHWELLGSCYLKLV